MRIARSRAPRLAPKMRSIFREVARDIIGRDRDARKYGRSQNTIGEIERALVNAYLMGQGSAANDTKPQEGPDDSFIDWIEVPPRSRDTLSSMTASFSERFGALQDSALQIERFSADGRVRWATVRNGIRNSHSVADGGVVPLIRLGLIAPVEGHQGLYALTDMGLATCRDYWRRSDSWDPSLPRISLR